MYAYVTNNPVNLVDHWGYCASGGSEKRKNRYWVLALPYTPHYGIVVGRDESELYIIYNDISGAPYALPIIGGGNEGDILDFSDTETYMPIIQGKGELNDWST